jgi:hypothetical protein
MEVSCGTALFILILIIIAGLVLYFVLYIIFSNISYWIYQVPLFGIIGSVGIYFSLLNNGVRALNQYIINRSLEAFNTAMSDLKTQMTNDLKQLVPVDRIENLVDATVRKLTLLRESIDGYVPDLRSRLKAQNTIIANILSPALYTTVMQLLTDIDNNIIDNGGHNTGCTGKSGSTSKSGNGNEKTEECSGRTVSEY